MGAGSDGGRGGNLKNMVIAFLVPLPSIFFYLTFVRPQDDTLSGGIPSPLTSWCVAHPLLLANVLFLLNVNVLFWLIGLLNNNWVSDRSHLRHHMLAPANDWPVIRSCPEPV
jgi:hypothetical protein